MVNLNNLFEFCFDETESKNMLYCVGDLVGNTSLVLSIKKSNGHIMKYSNEWLYLIKVYYPKSNFYNNLIDFYYNIYGMKYEIQVINDDVIPFITSFSTGTVHGYSGIYHIICKYLENITEYKKYKILVYKNSQKGILDIITHLCNKNVIDKNKIIYIDKNIIYHFHSVKVIPNFFHVFGNEMSLKVNKFITDNMSIDRNNIKYYNSLNLPKKLTNLCIIKGTNSTNLTNDGIFKNEIIINFCNKWDLTLIEPNNLDEIKLIHCVNQCKNLIISWGTSFFKNFVYISDDCEKIIVLIMKNSNFLEQYNNAKNSNSLIYKFKNAIITYLIVEQSLELNLF